MINNTTAFLMAQNTNANSVGFKKTAAEVSAEIDRRVAEYTMIAKKCDGEDKDSALDIISELLSLRAVIIG